MWLYFSVAFYFSYGLGSVFFVAAPVTGSVAASVGATVGPEVG